MSKRKPLISIQNIVASVSLNQKLTCKRLLKSSPDRIQPKQFPGPVFRLKNLNCYINFELGDVCTGAKSEKSQEVPLRKSLKNSTRYSNTENRL